MMDLTAPSMSRVSARSAVTAPPAPTMVEAAVRARRLVTQQLAVFSQHDLDAVTATFAPGARIFTGHRGPPVESEQGVRIYITSLYSQFPGLALELLSCQCEVDRAAGDLDGATPVTCEARWLARWHDPNSGRLLHQTTCGQYHIVSEHVEELRLHAWPGGQTTDVA